jgi:Phosphotransferase enzyme family
MLGCLLEDFLHSHGVRVTGCVEVVRERPWSLVAKVPTSQGLLWFKENRGATGYEAPLARALGEWAPQRVLRPVAVDAARAWTLLPDGGPTLRESHSELADWERMLTDHAVFQRDLGVRAAQMLALGVPDQRPGRLPELVETLTVPRAVAGYLPTLRQLCQELADSPVPASIQHDDLHDGNVFADGKVFDWGDASVAHPFGVLLVSLRVAATRFDAGEVNRLRDAYLEPWSDLAPRARLLHEVQLAVQVTKVSRALSWQRALVDATGAHYASFGDPVSQWLEELLVT